MIPIFVISLTDSVDRRKKIEKQFSKLKLRFEWFDAIRGISLSDEEIARLCDLEAIKNSNGWLNRGALGCALSHYYVYKEIIKRNFPYAIVLEDDVLLQDNFEEVVKNCVDQAKENEVILLYYKSWEALQLSKNDQVKISENYSLFVPIDFNQPITASAYMITNKACSSLTKTILPIRYAADCWGLFYKDGGFKQLRCIYPCILDTIDAKSTIEYTGTGLLNKILKVIDKRKVFPFYQLLLKRRRYMKSKMDKVVFIER